jgi:hypothetical protein
MSTIPESPILVKEGVPLASVYNDKSVAEQKSVNIAWELSMREEFRELRRIIYGEFYRFRQLMVNTVLATYIVDKDLGTLRNNRWDNKSVFQIRSEVESTSDNTDDCWNKE